MQNLEHAKLLEVLNYNIDTGEFTWRRGGKGTKGIGSKAGSLDKASGYLQITIEYKSYLAHRLAWYFIHGTVPRQIDHINRIRSDNRLVNLRIATTENNMANTIAYSTSKSGIKGLSYNERYKHYHAAIASGGTQRQKRFYLRDYATPEQAKEDALVWLQLQRNELHGMFANHG
jgi:hypothetical protein